MAAQAPVPPDPRPLRRVHQGVSRAQFAHPAENPVPRRAARPEQEDLGQALAIDLRRHRRVGQQGLEFRAEQEGAAAFGVEERFDAHPVPGQEEFLVRLVPDAEGEDAVEPLKAVRAPLDVGEQEHLGIGVALEGMPSGAQFLAQILRVVKLAVVGQDVDLLPAPPDHGLPAPRRVHDYQAAVAQGGAVRQPDPRVIRPPFGQGGGHCLQDRPRLTQIRLPIDPTGDAAHTGPPFVPKTTAGQ